MNEKIVCFHNPDEPNGYLSNWYLSDFTCDGMKFNSLEQYLMYKKAMTFGDSETAAKIMNSGDMRKIKRLGREVHNYDDKVWSEIRQSIAYTGLLRKFQCNKGLCERLLATGDNILAECAVHDKIWGIGLGMKDIDRFDQSRWRGQNILGFTLMKVRDELSSTRG